MFCAISIGKAVLLYENEGPGRSIMNMYHTQVPTELRGQGIAGQLAKVSSVVKLNTTAQKMHVVPWTLMTFRVFKEELIVGVLRVYVY